MSAKIAIPRLTIEGELGHGANSIVYRATLAGQACALKVPRHRGAWTRWVYREAVALARVHDAALPAVLEVGEADGLPFLAMELVEGVTLAERLRRGPLAASDALDLAATILRALDKVHDAGLVHRDVKPKNLIVGDGGRVRLVDFGFATPIERGVEGSLDLAGTPAYAAPEQLRAPARIDGRADLYALGVVLYECLAGRLPDRAERLELGSSDLGEDMIVVLGGLLAGPPEDRYPSARAVLADIDRVRARRAPLGPAAYPPPSTRAPIVGREVELARIADRFASVRTGGSVVIVRAGRGGGKTRLLTAAQAAWGEAGRLRTLATRCLENDAPWGTLRRLFDAYLAALQRAPSPDRAALVEALARSTDGNLGALAAVVSPAVGELLRVGAEPAAPSMGEGLAELLIRLFRRVGPVLVTVDDLQWVDAPSRDVLARVAHRAQEVPLALLLASRVDAAGETPVEPFRAAELARATHVDLARLDDDEVGRLVRLHLGTHEVSRETSARVIALGDGTPLGTLEVLGAMLDTGALRLEHGAWRLDGERADRVALPAGSFELLGRRLDGVPPATARVIELAAVLGPAIDDQVLASVVGLDIGDLGFALADARRAGVLVAEGSDGHRFAHDGLREIVIARLGGAAVRALHQQIAAALMALPAPSLDVLFATANHYAAGGPEAAPAAAYATFRRAAAAAFDQFDNEGARRFLLLGERAAHRAGVALDEAFFRQLGEAELRLGELEASARAFESALALAAPGRPRAEILGRLAWVHGTAADADRAWLRLGEAFEALGHRMPVESPRSVGSTIEHAARLGLRAVTARGRSKAAAQAGPDVDLLCDLHYLNSRLGMEYGRPFRLLQSTLCALDLSSQLGPSRIQARTVAMLGVVQTALGRQGAGTELVERAIEMAVAVGDPCTEAFAIQMRATAASFRGAFSEALSDYASLVDNRSHWLELNEFCLDVASADLIESVRGRVRESKVWIDKALARTLPSDRRAPIFDQMVVFRARASHAAAGSPIDDLPQPSEPSGFFRLISWGPRARWSLEREELGASFEALVEEFETWRRGREFHPALAEYYIALAHARAHQCLRAPPDARAVPLAHLRRAVVDLRAARQSPLFGAHYVLLEAYVAHFSGRPDEVVKHLTKAEALAREETCPWVLYGAARLRAHALMAAGKHDAALDEARVAEALAVQHGAATRARWIREEAALPEPAALAEHELSSRASSAGTRYLTALVQLTQASSGELQLEPQARSILDELLRDADATRGYVWLTHESAERPATVVGRSRDGAAAALDDRLEALLRAVSRAGVPWPEPIDGQTSARVGAPWIPDIDPRRCVALPLVWGERAVGAVFLERSAERPPIPAATRRLLSALAHQVALTLELSRLLEERDRLQRSLQQAQKMEAVGRLAGGVAHDINNMLSVTQLALDRMRSSGLDATLAEDVSVLAEGTDRAKHLVQQLLSFSRVRPTARERVHLHEVILSNQALTRTLLGRGVALAVDLGATSAMVMAEPPLLEQALFNLVTNARDAMGERGGTLTLSTANVTVDAPAPGGPSPGAYVVLSVSDTGEGMTEDVASRVFEPFFTTKPDGKGTGLGLATVYGFVQRAGGTIDVKSEVGRGTTFRIWLPVGAAKISAPSPSAPGRASVLVVDDEELVANSLRRILEGAGHRVLVALSGRDALDMARRHEPDIALALVDVRLADITGPQLVKQLWELALPRKGIYMSGHLPEDVLRELGDAPLVDKPFRTDDLLRRVALLKQA